MTIELVGLATMTAELRPPLVLSGTPAGDRMIFEVESGRLEGDRIRATLKGRAAADWLTVGGSTACRRSAREPSTDER
jgi:hypothetical protein